MDDELDEIAHVLYNKLGEVIEDANSEKMLQSAIVFIADMIEVYLRKKDRSAMEYRAFLVSLATILRDTFSNEDDGESVQK